MAHTRLILRKTGVDRPVIVYVLWSGRTIRAKLLLSYTSSLGEKAHHTETTRKLPGYATERCLVVPITLPSASSIVRSLELAKSVSCVTATTHFPYSRAN